MDVCKEKYYGNTYKCPEHFGELPFVPRPFVVRVFHSVSEGQGGDAEIISAVNDKSLLIFPPQFYILGFFIKKIPNACINQYRTFKGVCSNMTVFKEL